MKRRLAAMAAVAALGLRGSADPEAGAPVQCEVKLRDGSLIKGTLKAFAGVELKVKDGKRTIAAADLRSVTWGNVKREELDTVRTGKEALKGWIVDLEPLTVDTGFGLMTIPAGEVVVLRLVRGPETIGDDFESGKLDRWSPMGGGTWTAEGGKLRLEKRVGREVEDLVQFEEELEEAYTLECEIENPAACGVLLHVREIADATRVWFQSGVARVVSGGGKRGRNLAAWKFAYTSGATIRVKIEVDGADIAVSVDGVLLGRAKLERTQGRVGFFDRSARATFDNLTIRKKGDDELR